MPSFNFQPFLHPGGSCKAYWSIFLFPYGPWHKYALVQAKNQLCWAAVLHYVFLLIKRCCYFERSHNTWPGEGKGWRENNSEKKQLRVEQKMGCKDWGVKTGLRAAEQIRGPSTLPGHCNAARASSLMLDKCHCGFHSSGFSIDMFCCNKLRALKESRCFSSALLSLSLNLAHSSKW